MPLSQYRTGRSLRRASVLVLVRDEVPSIPLLRYWTGQALFLPHRITPVLHPPILSAATPVLYVPVPGGDYPGGPESSAFGSIPPAGLSRGIPNPRIKRIGGFYMQSQESRAVGSIPGMPRSPAYSRGYL